VAFPFGVERRVVAGPTGAEIAAGFRSALGSSTVVSSVRSNGALGAGRSRTSFADIRASTRRWR